MVLSMELEAMLFDLDGTLAETLPVCLSALRRAFRKYFGCDWSDQELLSCFGPTEEGVIKRLVPDQARECLETYYNEYRKAHKICREPFSGIQTALDLLRRNDVRMGIVTAKGRTTAEISLQYLHLDSYFEKIECGFEDKSNKPASIQKILNDWKIPPQHIAYLGDRVSDIKSSLETGIIPLAAAWSKTAEYDRLVRSNPQEIFLSVEDFIDWIKRTILQE